MSNWDEYRTAYHVARTGTVSGAATSLGVHHATVIRHIDTLEARLGTKLFQRHARGYSATDAGADLLKVAQVTDDQLTQLEARLKGRGNDVTGELVVTTLPGLSPLMAPILASFRAKYPDVIVRYLTSERVFRLEYGEAHVAIRAGQAPNEPDNVVQKLTTGCVGMYASQDYIDRKGMPADESELAQHDFVVSDQLKRRAPFYRWLMDRIPEERAIFRATEGAAVSAAIAAGVGIGFQQDWDVMRPDGLVEVMAPRPEWTANFWLVTHMDLHRTVKVQAFLKHLKAHVADW